MKTEAQIRAILKEHIMYRERLKNGFFKRGPQEPIETFETLAAVIYQLKRILEDE